MGYAIAHALNEESGLFTNWTSTHDETIAEVLGQIVACMLLDEEQQRAAAQLFVLENARCAISARTNLSFGSIPLRRKDFMPSITIA
jgi:hypothetical protein